MNIPAELAHAMNATWQAIGPDAMEFCENNEEAIEMILDANRLETYGSKVGQEALDKLVKEHGYQQVAKRLNKTFVYV